MQVQRGWREEGKECIFFRTYPHPPGVGKNYFWWLDEGWEGGGCENYKFDTERFFFKLSNTIYPKISIIPSKNDFGQYNHLKFSVKDTFYFDADLDPGSSLEKKDPDPGSALEKNGSGSRLFISNFLYFLTKKFKIF